MIIRQALSEAASGVLVVPPNVPYMVLHSIENERIVLSVPGLLDYEIADDVDCEDANALIAQFWEAVKSGADCFDFEQAFTNLQVEEAGNQESVHDVKFVPFEPGDEGIVPLP